MLGNNAPQYTIFPLSSPAPPCAVYRCRFWYIVSAYVPSTPPRGSYSLIPSRWKCCLKIFLENDECITICKWLPSNNNYWSEGQMHQPEQYLKNKSTTSLENRYFLYNIFVKIEIGRVIYHLLRLLFPSHKRTCMHK